MSKAQLSRLIDLPDDALDQVIDYARTLSKPAAVEHFSNLLGHSPAAIEFISAFNSRGRSGPAPTPTPAQAATPTPSASLPEPAPQHQRKKKKKAPLHTPPARQVANLAPSGAVYNKKNIEDDYMGGGGGKGRSGPSTPLPSVSGSGIQRGASPAQPQSQKAPPPPPQQQQPQQPQQTQKARSSGGSLISDALAPKPKKTASSSSGNGGGKSATVTKISITGGTAMHGAATALSDLETAIRTLEISTNPVLRDAKGSKSKNGSTNEADDVDSRRCNCVGTRHPLQTAAPNCTSCGKVICVKEGLGPCTFCGTALLSSDDIQAMIKALRAERGRERMAADREAHQKPAFTGPGGSSARGGAGAHMIAGKTKWGGDDDGFVSLQEAARKADDAQKDAAAKARAHRDKLLAYQAENAQRTTVRDEAADYDVGDALAAESGGFGRNLWASPEERAHKLRQQQKLLREMEWNARPEYEKRQQVLSIDVTGRKVFRKVVAVERPPSPEGVDGVYSDNENDEYGVGKHGAVLTDADGNKGSARSGGTFSNNPLLGKMIKPVYDAQGRAEKEREIEREKQRERDIELRREQKREQKKEDKENKKSGKGKAKADDKPGGKVEGNAKAEEQPEALHLRGRADDPNAATRWRRVQDDIDNEAVILDGGIYGSAPPVVDEPECG
ncbi:c2hc5 finger protein [Ophiostoma piceae UAMH 11346]|uniref:C2hc5 finger protein n=1 Tax=Ophiostoma piceae (strain UAMH 11346) TaxID=1262450 RepID=S3CW57_OPHP1|nr:c2hc5 finger protein [Ophiostoma piceae UAMH 11346]